MTTNTRDFGSLHTSSTDAGGRAGLRLVVGGVDGSRGHEAAKEEPAMPCVVLKSAIVDRDQCTLSVLTNLFKDLRQGERIDFLHRIRRVDSKSALAMQPYSLSVNVACAPDVKNKLCSKIAEALVTAYPGFHFVARDGSPGCASENPAPPEPLLHMVQIAPAGVVVTAKPAIARFEQQARLQDSEPGRLPEERRNASRQVWPYPEKLANWPLTAPLYEPMELPEAVEISIRIHAFSLSAETCEALHQTVMRILAGNLVVYHPESPIAAYSASTELQESTVELMQNWLRHPAGYAIDCVVRSNAPLSNVAQRRIAADVFGKRPFEAVRCFDGAAPQRLAQPTLAWACASAQGIPALMPGLMQLPSLAVPRHYSTPPVMPPQSGTWLGTTVCGRRSTAVALPYESRSRHVALIGATGSGKSSLLTQMIAQDIADPQRRCGVGLIDPHGDLYQRVLSMIPPARAEDVVLVDTADRFNTACLNPLEGMRNDPLHAQFVVGEIMSLIDLLFENRDSSGPVTRNNLRNLLLLSGSTPSRHGTFLDAMRILEDSDYCDFMLANCNNRNVVDYWRNFRETRSSENGYVEWAPYIMARLAPFVTHPIMKRLLSRPDSTIDLAQAMREKKIVLFNLNKGVLQDVECQVLGALILMKFFSAALSRSRVSLEQHAPFHLYVDEFQTFATDSVPRMFSEGRKGGLCCTTANQSLGQLENRWGRSNIAESILANTATKFLFRLGPSDVEILQPYFRPEFNAGDMVTLPDFHAVACMLDRNRTLPPFVLRANLAARNPEVHVPAADLLNLSRKRYTVPTDQANRELMKLYDLSAESLGTVESAPVPDPQHEKDAPADVTRTGSNLTWRLLGGAAMCLFLGAMNPTPALACVPAVKGLDQYCSNPAFASAFAALSKSTVSIAATPSFTTSEREAITQQHERWLQNLPRVCKKDVKCAMMATSKRTRMYAWATEVQNSELPPERKAADIAKAVRVAIVAVSKNGDFTGSGVIVGKQAVLTNCHVTDDMTADFAVADSNGRRHKIAGIRGLALIDMCILTVPTLTGDARISIAPFSGFEIGSTIYTFGNPHGAVRSFSGGMVSAVRASNSSASSAKRTGIVRFISIQHDALQEPGSSGGALLDSRGRLIGLTTYGVGKRVTYAVAIQFLGYLPARGVMPGSPYHGELDTHH